LTAIILALALALGYSIPDTKADLAGDATWYGQGGRCVDGFKRTCSPYLSGERRYYAAVGSWKWGDKPYLVRVCRVLTGKCIYATVRDFCLACKNKHGIIDLSPRLFRQLAGLGVGRIDVLVTKVAATGR
jgi:hypothetical protein